MPTPGPFGPGNLCLLPVGIAFEKTMPNCREIILKLLLGNIKIQTYPFNPCIMIEPCLHAEEVGGPI